MMLSLDSRDITGVLCESPHKMMQKLVDNSYWCDLDKVA